jgi:ABC-type multidrug transport system fused ATPase/permease subunit
LPEPTTKKQATTKQLLEQLPATLRLVWEADRFNAIVLAVLTLSASLFPAAMAYVGKLIVDSVVLAVKTGAEADQTRVLQWVGVELGLAVANLLLGRVTGFVQELLRSNLANLINVRILEKALTLELRHFEDSEVYDSMQNARREASMRPLSLALAGLSLIESAITFATLAGLLVSLAWWSVLVLVAAAVPAFISETRLSGESFRLWSWRAAEGRKMNYLEWILTRDSHVKEVKLYDLGPLVLGRYKGFFSKFFGEDKALARKRMLLGAMFSTLALTAFYACYLFVAHRASLKEISLGDLTLYVAVFRQGQGALTGILSEIAGMYENALFMSNLFKFLNLPTVEGPVNGARASLPAGRYPLVLEHVSMRYPGKEAWALRDINLVIQPGEKIGLVGNNGAGKSTLIKLLLRLYEPTEGRITYGGIDLRELDPKQLRERFGAVFQDFARYQFSVAENVGLGDIRRLEDRAAIETAIDKGGASELVQELPAKLDTMLGGWFEKGHELSAGQWQKLAVSRAFMRDAEVLILDEPTASIDAEAEVALFERFRTLAADRSAVIISHRFSTVRMADRIAVLDGGKLVELGSHAELVKQGGRYAHLFELQARGYMD